MMIDLINGDCLQKMKEIPESSIDLTVTSPPYDNLRSYDKTARSARSACNAPKLSINQWESCLKELFRITKVGGVVVWVVGDATIKGCETGTSFRQALFAMSCGFNLHDTMIYKKKGGGCCGSKQAYLSNFEYMFVFTKGKLKTFNAIRDRKNVRKPSVKVESVISNRKESKRHKKLLVRAEYGKRFNVWEYHTGKNVSTKDQIAFKHPAIFPEKLAQDHILSWSNEGDTVFDCYMGSGTVGKMAVLNNRNFIGIELIPDYFEISKTRINQAIENKNSAETLEESADLMEL